tara:strand:+ start:1852 stop:2133 length:282 start_codon:yes stop_codon:yes gene_type:complete
MGKKARKIRSNKFAKKFAALREKAAGRLGLTKEQPAPAKEAAPAVDEALEAPAVEEALEAPAPASEPKLAAKPAKPAKKAPAKKSRKSKLGDA